MKEKQLVFVKRKQSIYSYVEFSQKDDKLGIILKFPMIFEKLILKWEKVENFVLKNRIERSLRNRPMNKPEMLTKFLKE